MAKKADNVVNMGGNAKAAALRSYLREIGTKKLLNREDEKDLSQRIQAGDEEARRQFLEANLRLVVYVAKRYAAAGDTETLLDLIQEGNLGLFRAVERYDPSFATRFSTYAVYWIRQAIQRYVARNRAVRLPENVMEDVNRMRRKRHALYQELGRQPTEEEIAKAMDLTLKNVLWLEDISQATVSIEQPLKGEGGEGTELGELLQDLDQPQPEFIVNQNLLRHEVREAIKTLPARHQELVSLRFGLNGEPPLTLSEIGQRFGVSRERVRQLQEEALAKIRGRKDLLMRLK